MRKFIFAERNGIHIIDLRKTQILIEYARDVIHEIAAQGRIVMFVGTKHQAKPIIEAQAQRCEMNYVTERWLGGMLTNFQTIRKSIKRLENIDKMEEDGTFENITKKERLLLSREKDRLRKVFGGIEKMTRLPGAIFVIDAKKEHLAVKEARNLGIPVIGIIDTNTDPDMVDYPIPANDDSALTIDLISSVMADAIIEGSAVAKVRQAELGYDPNAKEEGVHEVTVEKQRRMRDRRGSGDRSGGGRGRERGDRQPREPRGEGNRERSPRRDRDNRGNAANAAAAKPTAPTPTENNA
jgi:small subunit ribosomal protein S2